MVSENRPNPDCEPSETMQENCRYLASGPELVPAPVGVEAEQVIQRQAKTDEQLIELWLHGRRQHTQRAYRADVTRLQTFVGKALHQVHLSDLQRFSDDLVATGLHPASQHRRLAAIKSLFSFAYRLGYLPFDTSKPLRLPRMHETLAERILTEEEVRRILAAEPSLRNSILLHLLYASGARVSEVCSLRWKNVQARSEGGQITVLGKGSKTRAILLPSGVFRRLVHLRGDAGDEQAVFRSRRGGHLHPSQVLRIVKTAAKRAGIERNVVVHTFRHCHASHALERQAPIHLVQQSLGHASIATTGRYLHARPTDGSSRYLKLG